MILFTQHNLCFMQVFLSPAPNPYGTTHVSVSIRYGTKLLSVSIRYGTTHVACVASCQDFMKRIRDDICNDKI
jgi:hypothetical protein